MFCPKCGKQVDESANYCSNCGTALRDIAKAEMRKNTIQWEKCQIEYEMINANPLKWYEFGPIGRKEEGCFYAEAAGPNGRYVVAKSPVFIGGIMLSVSDLGDEKAGLRGAAWRSLDEALLRDGWELVYEDNRTTWYNRYKKRILIP